MCGRCQQQPARTRVSVTIVANLPEATANLIHSYRSMSAIHKSGIWPGSDLIRCRIYRTTLHFKQGHTFFLSKPLVHIHARRAHKIAYKLKELEKCGPKKGEEFLNNARAYHKIIDLFRFAKKARIKHH